MVKLLIKTSTLLMIVLLMGCGKKESIILDREFEINQWNSFDVIEFVPLIQNKEKPYQVKINIKLTDKFESKDFSFGLSKKNDDGESIYSHHSIPVRARDGNWISEPIDGIYSYSLIVNNATFFSSESQYRFFLESTMAKYNVKGVKQIQLEIVEK